MSMYGESDYNEEKNRLFDDMEYFLETHPIEEFLRIVADIIERYEPKGEVEGQIIITSTPKAREYGMGVGSFPGQTHALNDYWWYRDKDGRLRFSQGTE